MAPWRRTPPRRETPLRGRTRGGAGDDSRATAYPLLETARAAGRSTPFSRAREAWSRRRLRRDGVPGRFMSAMSAVTALLWIAVGSAAPGEDLAEPAGQALRKAATFFRSRVSTRGGYVWRYSEDLALREGESRVSETTIWVQPPGTPAVGLAYLRAHEATGERFYLDGAADAARALVQGQLRSGGWTYRIEFDPEERRRHAYRTDPEGKKRRNWSTLDDDTTQSALRLRLWVDRALGFKEGDIHQAALFGLEALLKAQHP